MRNVLLQLLISVVVSLGAVAWYHTQTHYSPGERVNDALACVLALGREGSSFDVTGLVGDRGGDHRYLWIMGKEERLGSSLRAVQCKITTDQLQVTHPTLGTIVVQR